MLGCHLPLIECPENESIAFRYPEIGREDEDKRARAMSEVNKARENILFLDPCLNIHFNSTHLKRITYEPK